MDDHCLDVLLNVNYSSVLNEVDNVQKELSPREKVLPFSRNVCKNVSVDSENDEVVEDISEVPSDQLKMEICLNLLMTHQMNIQINMLSQKRKKKASDSGASSSKPSNVSEKDYDAK